MSGPGSDVRGRRRPRSWGSHLVRRPDPLPWASDELVPAAAGAASPLLCHNPLVDDLRVGVSGHRRLADPAAVAVAVDRVLDRLHEGRDRGPDVVAVSSLAEGADRIVATRVLARGGRLEAVLPLPAEDYATDFADAGSRAEFAALLAVADPTTVVPADPADPSREAAYARAGTAVLEACDVLLALWDGAPARGRGGTAEVVAEARSTGRRVEVVTVERAP